MAYSAKIFCAAIDGSGGFKTVVAARVGCSLSTVYSWIEKSPSVKEAFELEEEKNLDFAEGKLQALINKSNVAAVIFYLKTKGRNRGYVERQEVETYELPSGFDVTIVEGRKRETNGTADSI